MAGGCVVGVDLGGTKLLAGLVDPSGEVLARSVRPAGPFATAEAVLDAIAEEVLELRTAADARGARLEAVGLGIPSFIDQRTGTAVSTVHQPLQGVAVRDEMTARLGLPVHLDNDANCAMLAEWRGGGAGGSTDAVLLTLGTGIGSGIVSGGRLVRGATGAATELGHTTIDLRGPRCACGNRGCLEALCSGPALAREGTRLAVERPGSALARHLAAGGPITGEAVSELAHAGDEAAGEAILAVALPLGVGIANVMNLLEPEVVLVGGGMSAAGELLLGPAREEARRRARPPGDAARVALATFGSDAGMRGAAVLAREGTG